MELELRVVWSAPFAPCSALVNLSTRLRVSLGDNSPSSPHLRLERSGGHMRWGYCFYEATAAEMLDVAMLPEDSRKKFRSVFYIDTKLVRHGFIHARSAPQGIGQRCSRTLLLPSVGLCFP